MMIIIQLIDYLNNAYYAYVSQGLARNERWPINFKATGQHK